MKKRKRQQRCRTKSFLVKGVTKRGLWDDDPLRGNTRQRLKREIDREIRSYE